jgi:hypothetical protein
VYFSDEYYDGDDIISVTKMNLTPRERAIAHAAVLEFVGELGARCGHISANGQREMTLFAMTHMGVPPELVAEHSDGDLSNVEVWKARAKLYDLTGDIGGAR